jgi:hypothetical protein
MPTIGIASINHGDRRAANRRMWRHPRGPSLRPLPDGLQVKAKGYVDPATAPPMVGLQDVPITQFSQDPNSIVTVKVQTIQAPTPNTYQQTGCFVSFGATGIARNDAAELTQWSDLSDVIIASAPAASVAWAAGLVTLTTAAPLGVQYAPGDTPQMSITGFVPTGYNYNGPVTIVDTATFTYPVVADPGPTTTVGNYTPQSSIELSQMATTYFDQGNMTSVWVLELGYGATIAANVAALESWLAINTKTFCGFLLPRACGSNQMAIDALKPLFKQYQHPEAMTYFWLTVGPSVINELDETYKCVIQLVEAPAVTNLGLSNASDPMGEFTMAAMFYNAMAFKPSQINRVAPMAFKYLYGVTAYPTKNNGPLLSDFKKSSTNYVATGAEGGVSYNIVYEGVTRDGQDYFNWWWTIDWVQININLNLSNAIINGSNNPFAPLYYNQDGINFLETNLYNTMLSASTLGMVLGPLTMTGLNQPDLQNQILLGVFEGMCDVNAVQFVDYVNANPGHYKIGEYDGLSVLFIPARGFIHIMVSVTATDLVTV